MTSQTLPPEATHYLAHLQAAVADLPADVADETVADIRAHLSEAVAAGRPVAPVVESLGPAEQVAAEVRESLGLGTTDHPPGSDDPSAAESQARKVHRSRTGLSIAAGATGLVTAIFLGFVAPAFVERITDPVLPPWRDPGAVLLTVASLLPALLVVAPQVFPPRNRGPATLAAAVAVSVVAALSPLVPALGALSLWLPTVLLAWAAVIVPRRVRLRAGRPANPGWRIAGAAVLALPAVLGLGGLATATVLPTAGLAVWIVASAVLAVLYALGVRAAQLVVACVGALMMVATTTGGALSSPLIWLLGGAWLTLGLGAFAATGWRLRAPR